MHFRIPKCSQGYTMQEEYHRQRQVGDRNESEEGPQKHGDAATGTFDDSEEGEADGYFDHADAEDVERFGDGAEFEHGDDGFGGDAGYVATHTGGDQFGEEPAR